MDDSGEMETENLRKSNDSGDGGTPLECANYASGPKLQLAALLGKSLLIRNNELEQNLRRLQEYAEETMSTNQTLVRQVGELRNSLQFSNESCEQLEQKTEELERNNIQLQKLCDIQQTLLTQKTSILVDLHKDYSQLKHQLEQLQVKVVVGVTDATSCEFDQKLHSKTMESKGERKFSETGDNSDITELKSTLSELTLKVQNVSFQKQKSERELESVINENQSLAKALERADVDIAELLTKLRSYEESSLELTLSPKSGSQPFSSAIVLPPHVENLRSTSSAQLAHKSFQKTPRQSTSEQIAGLSLFSELDGQYSTLTQRYQELVENCTCSASLSHKQWLPPETPANFNDNNMKIDSPFKELFDEVFATLKQTTLVADKLIERKNSK